MSHMMSNHRNRPVAAYRKYRTTADPFAAPVFDGWRDTYTDERINLIAGAHLLPVPPSRHGDLRWYFGRCDGCESPSPQPVQDIRGDWGAATVCAYHTDHE